MLFIIRICIVFLLIYLNILNQLRERENEGGSEMDFDRLKEIIVDTLACDENKVTLDADMEKDLEIDSLSLVELHMALEDELAETIPDGEIGKLHTVRDVLNYVNDLKK